MPSPVRFAVVRKILEAKGYSLVRIRGSHHVFAKTGHDNVVVPVHKGKVKPVYVREAERAE